MSWANASMLTDGKHGSRVVFVPKEKDAPRRMMRDAAGNEYPARQIRSFWIEEPTYKAFKNLAAKNRQAAVEQVRQLMRESVDRHKEESG